MSDTIFISGMFVEDQETQYGTFQKISVDIQKLNDFARQYGSKSENNGKTYLNIDLMKSKEGKSYMKLNQWKPKEKIVEPVKSAELEKFDDDEIPF